MYFLTFLLNACGFSKWYGQSMGMDDDAEMMVVGDILIGEMTDRTEKLQLICFDIFLNGVCQFIWGKREGYDGGRQWCAAPVSKVVCSLTSLIEK